jgi:DNA repair photolyase
MSNDEIKYGYQSPRWTGEIADCSLPLTFDTYSNCSFGCVYCFSQYQRGIGGAKEDYFSKKVKAVSPEKIKKIFSLEDKNNQFYQYIKTRRPIQYGGLSDQFDGFEKKYGVTYEILKYLREINYPICFSTKSAWVFHDPKYQELFKSADNWNVKFSIITLDERDAKRIEVGVPTPRERLDAMREYNKLSKGGTTLRLRPFIVGVSDKTYLDLIKEAADAGATAVTTEFFCLEMRSIKQAREHYQTISDCAGFDIIEFYRKYSNGSGYLRLNRKVKEKYIYKMKELCHDLGMRFYVSDAHFKECSDNCCCCALPPSWDYSRGHFAAALQIAKKTGEVRWSDIEKDMYFLDFEYRKAQGFNVNSSENRAKFDGMTMKEYLRYLWNAPRRGQSPYKIFERVLKPDGVDENGDIIYKYDQSTTFELMQNKSRTDVLEMRV